MTIRQLLDQPGADHPKLRPILDQGVTVAIDGVLCRGAWHQPIPPSSEVVILPRMAVD